MGNAAWGHGHHKGSTDGYRTGFGQGSAAGAAVTVIASTLLAASAWGYEKLKKSREAEHEQGLLADGGLMGSGEDGDSEDERNS